MYTRFQRAGIGIFFLSLLFFLFSSCQRFFIPVKQKTETAAEKAGTINTFRHHKYFILHEGDKMFSMKDITLNEDSFTLRANLGEVDPEHLLYITPRKNQFRYSNDGKDILNEVHIFITDDNKPDLLGYRVIPLSHIEKIEVIEEDSKKTRSSYILGGLGIGLGVLVLTGVIVALTKSSCPFISVHDGTGYQLQGELFGGAVYPNLERADFVPLRAGPVNGRIEIKISNELKERQYTNFADLLIAEHPLGTEVAASPEGKIYQFNQLLPPLSATLNKYQDCLEEVIQRDTRYCSFNDSGSRDGINKLELVFAVPEKTGQACLLIQCKNDYWFDYLYGEFTRKFGSGYNDWQQKQRNKPASEIYRWMEEQEIPLRISVSNGESWTDCISLKTVGPLAHRLIAVPLPADKTEGNQLKIRLTTGFRFWELDYAAIDFNSTLTDDPVRIKPIKAVDENGSSVMGALAASDSLYLEQPEVGQYAEISYPWNKTARPGYQWSYFLHTSGYYEPVRNYQGDIQSEVLLKFREPASLSRFSVERFKQIPHEYIIALNNR